MGIKWRAVFEHERKQFEGMTEGEKFVYFLLLQYGSPYGWGKENPESSDCSGAVCMALYAATGLLIRMTADDLYRKVFTVKNPGQEMIRAAFFITGQDGIHGDRKVGAGTVVHAAGLLDEGVILNSEEPAARIRDLESVSAWFRSKGNSRAIRGLGRGALERLFGEGARYGLDGEWGRYFV